MDAADWSATVALPANLPSPGCVRAQVADEHGAVLALANPLYVAPVDVRS